MSLREAAQQALEALEKYDRVSALEFLRTALAEPEQEPVAYVTGAYAGHFTVVPTNPALVLTTGMALYTHPVDDTALLRQAYLLCDEINKMPHVRGSINGMAVQLQYALRERLGEKT